MTFRVRALALAFWLPVATAAGLALACGGEESRAPAPVPPTPTAERPDAVQRASAPAARPKRVERPLPAFSGTTLDGESLRASDLLGKRLLVIFFDPASSDSEVVLQATSRVAALGAEHNFSVLGVASGRPRSQASALVERLGVDFPVLDDASQRIRTRMALHEPTAVLVVDAEGYIVWGSAHFATQSDDAVARIESQLRDELRIAEPEEIGDAERPEAPLFTAARLDGGERFDLAALRGEPVVLIFFLHTCPHCHEALAFLKEALAGMPEDARPHLVGLEITGRSAAVRSSLAKEGLDFFPVIFADEGDVMADYGVFGGVPDIFLIDAEGRITARTQGWRPEIDAPLLRMRMTKVAGRAPPMLLRTDGYSGSEVCGVCHDSAHQTWQLTNHARAFDTLVTHGANADPECVGCHVVGFGEPGGFVISPPTAHLEDVGCESCHGRGGPHLSPGFVEGGDYEPVCLTCHDKKHSLGFDYATFLPQVSHAANAHILALPAEERRAILAERGALRTDLLPQDSAYVGSEACRSCHEAEYATWAANPHAGALASLEAKGEAGNADCLRCHTTGFGRDGGFPKNAAPAAHPDLARVGCESCHGPGAAHVVEDSAKLGSIVSLGDKCDSCVILQICGGCHDDANDPGFEFEVQDKIDRIRHGTIEAGTGKPLGNPAGQDDSAATRAHDERALLARAFALRDRS